MPGIAALLVSGCATTSFAPPQVQADKRISAGRIFTCDQLDYGDAIQPNVLGSIDLTNNFIRAYRCASHEAADGRQVFEVPSMLALITAAVGASFGLKEDGVLAAATGAAVLARGNSYYAPKEKAAVLDTALDAVLCVKAAAVGFEFFDTRAAATPQQQQQVEQARTLIATLAEKEQEAQQKASALKSGLDAASGKATISNSDRQKLMGLMAEKLTITPRFDAQQLGLAIQRADQDAAAATTDREQAEAALAELQTRFYSGSAGKALVASSQGVVEIDLPRQHFEMVSTALFSIERVLAQRLSNIGSFDPAGISAQFEKLAGKESEVQEEKKDLVESGTKDGKSLTAGTPQYNDALAQIDLKLMQTRLQNCVVRAKV